MDSLLKNLRHDNYHSRYHSFVRPVANYSAKNESLFWSKLCQLVSDDSSEFRLHLGERVQDSMPLMASGVLTFSGEKPDDISILKISEFVLFLVAVYQECIQEYIEMPSIDFQESFLSTAIQLQQQYDMDANISGFKIRFLFKFPYVRLSLAHCKQFRLRVIERLRNQNLQGVLTRELRRDSSSWEKILEDLSDKEFIPFYGNTETPNQAPMEHWKCIGPVTFEELENDEIPERPLEELFETLDSHALMADGSLEIEHFHADFEDDPEVFLPLFYSLNFWTNTSAVQPGIYDAEERSGSPHMDETDTHAMIQFLMTLISTHRVGIKGDWLAIGAALYHSTEASSIGRRMWIDFTMASSESPFSNRYECAEECSDIYFNCFGANYRTFITLAYFAKQDSPDEYRHWHDGWCRKALEEAADDVNSLNLGKAFYRCFFDVFLFEQKAKQGEWWYFKKSYWRPGGHIHFERYLKNNQYGLYHRFNELLVQLSTQASVPGITPAAKKELNGKIANVAKILGQLSEPKNYDAIMRSCRSEFLVENFEKKADSHFELMGCEDCVLDTSGDRAVFRPGMPEDFVTMSTGHYMMPDPDFPELNLSHDHPQVKAVRKWFRQMFPREDMRGLARRYSASMVHGGNDDKVLALHWGPTHAGKSGMSKGMQAALGPYWGIVPVLAIGGDKGDANSADEIKMQFKRCNGVGIQETKGHGKNCYMSGAWIKGMTGNDDLPARHMYGKLEIFRLRQKMSVYCNEPPRLEPNSGQALYERVTGCVILYESRFDRKAPKSEEEQYRQMIFPRNPDFDDEIKRMGRAFLWVMAEDYPEYRRMGLSPPERSLKAAQKYWDSCDLYSKYLKENFIRDDREEEDENGEIIVNALEFSQVYDMFKGWFKSNYPGERIPDADAFEAGMCEPFRLGELNEDREWPCWNTKSALRSRDRQGQKGGLSRLRK